MPKISALPQETEITSNDKIAFVDSDATPQRTHYITLADFVASVFGTGTASGWNTLNAGVAPTVSTGYNKGNKEYDLTFSNVNLTTSLSPGMRMKLDRTGSVPTQCTDLEASSSQYWSKTSPSGLSFTDDFTCEAWIKLESYGSSMGIVARRNADTEGFSFQLDTNGRLLLIGLRIAGNNRYVSSYQSVPLGRWVHVAASLDMSGNTGAIYIDGVSVPTFMTTNGTATALVQGTTALVVGAEKSAGTSPFDGKLTDVRVWSVIRTATEIRDNMNQHLTGSETNLVAYYKFNGDALDSTSNANNLSANGSASATATDNPINATEQAIITKVTYAAPNTTVTVFTGTDYNIPNATMENPYYSSQKSPYGFPAARSKWFVETILKSPIALGASSVTWYSGSSTNSGSAKLAVPIGEWNVGYYANIYTDEGSNSLSDHYMTLCRTAGTETDKNFTTHQVVGTMTANVFHQSEHAKEQPVATTSLTDYFLMGQFSSVNNNPSMCSASAPSYIKAECAYI